MATLIELATEMVVTRAKSTPLTAEEMLTELNRFHAALKKLEAGESTEEVAEVAPPATFTLKDAFKKNEVVCLVCMKGGFKTLARHLSTAHNITAKNYRKQYGISAKQSLSSRAYSEARRQMANERGLADNLKKAREVRMVNIEAAKSKPVAASKAKSTGVKTKLATKAKTAKA